MDKRVVLAGLLFLSFVSCSRHEQRTPVNYSPPPLTGPSDAGIRAAIVQQSVSSYPNPCPCPYSGPTCKGHSAYDKRGGQRIYCYTKDVSAEMVTTYRAILARN